MSDSVKNRLSFILVFSLVIGLIFLSACSSTSSTKRDEQYSFATGPTGGSFFPLGGTIAEMWNKNVDGVNVTAQATSAGLENLRLLKSDEAAFALLPESISYFGATGTGIVQDLNEKFENFYVMARIYPEIVQIFAHKDSNINSIQDFKGKKVSIGAPGGYQQILAKQVFELVGIGEEDFSPSYTGYTEAAELFQDKMIDGGFFMTGLPNATLTQLSTSAPFHFIPVDDNVFTELQKELPFASKIEIPSNAYSSLDNPTETFSIWALLLVRKDLSDDIVYDLTKALFEQADEMGKVNAQAKWIDVNNVNGLSLSVHPGAKKYYKEKGIDVE